MTEQPFSLSPNGEAFALPVKGDVPVELKRIEKLVATARQEKKEIVVVMGLGFVGAVMAAIVADTRDTNGKGARTPLEALFPQPGTPEGECG